jgi:nucleoside 2-deoxyribosyltransferase
MDIYLAGPLFTDAELAFNLALATRLRAAGHAVFLPQQQCEGLASPRDIFSACVNGLSGSQIVVAVLDGADADSGTCWECGYACAKGMKVVGLRTDVRKGGDDGSGLNLMLSVSAGALVRSVDELLKYLAGS